MLGSGRGRWEAVSCGREPWLSRIPQPFGPNLAQESDLGPMSVQL